MLVGDQTKEVRTGELIYIPSGVMHGIENLGESTLSYLSAANPAYDYPAAYDNGELTFAAYETSRANQAGRGSQLK
jgi:oxalate decarboxylase/phosphoglucose isomerase-like protein (cupin superfamily)